MIMPARIIAATDLSAPSHHAVDRGFRIAADTGARYSVIHAIELSALDELSEFLGDGTSELKQRLADQARATLWDMLGNPARNCGVGAEASVFVGEALEAIASVADGFDADLLVLGARGESFLRHALLGSTASRLLRKSIRRPVLVVKQPAHDRYRRLLISVDFSPVSAHAIRFGRALAPEADVVLLHAFELPYEGKLSFAGVDDKVIQQYVRTAGDERRRRLHALAASAGLAPADYSALVVHGIPSQQVIVQEQERDIDLIIMGKHGKHLAEEMLLGSVTKHVLAESQCDVLVVPGGRLAPDEY